MTAAQAFNNQMRLEKERRDKEKEKEELGKRKLKPQMTKITKRRQVES